VASDVPNIGLLMALRLAPLAGRASGRSSWEGLVAGARYAGSQPAVRALLLTAAGFNFFGQPYTQIMPVFARHVLDVGPSGLGLLLTMPAVGTIVAAFSLALLGNVAGKGRLLLGVASVFALGLLAFAASQLFALSLAILVVVGAAGTVSQTLGNTLLQHTVPDRMRGRVMSFWIIATQGASPLGAVPAGLVAQAWGAPAAVSLGAAMVLAVLCAMALAPDGLRRLD
jgi:predicted MFS family arabinose efflux permease